MEIARRRLTDVADAFDGLLMEDKGRSLALHYRAAPQLESYVLDSVRSLGEDRGDEYAIQVGKYVVELRPAGTDKGEAIRAFMAEIIERSLKDPDRKGCLLVNSALDVAPHDAELGQVVAGYLEELRAFFRRNIDAARRAGQVPKSIDAEEVANHLLGVLAGIRVLARTGARRKALESVARPALALLERPR